MKRSMKHLVAAYAAVPVLGLGVLGAAPAMAQGLGGFGPLGFFSSASADEIASRQNSVFTEQAQILGISVEDYKAAWAQGKSFQQIATDKGISQQDLAARLKTAAANRLKQQLQTLVDKGVITQAQADQRYSVMQTRMQSAQNGKGRMHGMGRGLGM
jgi:ribosomal protein S20